ncbi:MAG TPA: wax ester/triacylglycerol synthase domain-containing protein, partial [Solirubrobacterales bacterium]|nr:wax ester/triacylglycerol synthase domain-containing protein [Solirubrobacterales bacterium]
MAQRHMDRLTSFDTSFLANEKSNGHMAIGAVLVCEGVPPSHEEFLASIRSRLHLLPRLRQRLAYPPLGLGRPFWVDHAGFDVHEHVSRRKLAAPGDDDQFRDAVAETFAPPLDRSRPLWELCLVEGMENDRFAIVYKTHHAMADGISAVDIGVLLFDVEPTTEAVPEPAPWEPKTAPSRMGLAGQA